MKWTLLRTVLLGGCLSVAGSIQAADVFKANNTNDLNDTNSWVGLMLPTTSDVAVWDSTVTSANSTLLGANLDWAGMRIANPGGAVTIDAGNTLTLRASGLDMSSATVNLTLSNSVSLKSDVAQTWSVASGRTLTLEGSLNRGQPGGVLKFQNSGTVSMPGVGASAGLLYTLVNGTDIGYTDGSSNLSTRQAVNGYDIPSAGGGLGTQYADIQNGATGSDPDINNGTTIYYPRIIRFNTPHPNRDYWLMQAHNGQFSLNKGPTPNTILVTANVGANDIYFTSDGGQTVRWGQSSPGSELVVMQENTAGTLYFDGNLSEKYALSGNSVTKSGAGKVVFNSGVPVYGPTHIFEGEMAINGPVPNSAVTVNSGATLSGAATIGNTVVNSGTIAVGDNGAGTMTVGSGLTLNDGTKLQFYSPAVEATNTSALLFANGAGATVNGTVTVDILSGTLVVGTYPLLQSTNGGITSSFVLGQIKPHVTAHLTNTTTTLSLVVDSVNQPLTWATGSATWQVGGSPIWKDSLGADTTYQELNGLGDSVLFENLLSGTSPMTVTLNTALNPSTVTVNSAKDFTFSGGGGIAGGTYLTKSGSGTLTLSTANSFSGGLNLNGGTTIFSSLGNLGSGAISFGGGGLQYSGNTDDISVRTVTFNAGGATINIGANDVTFASPVGNGGAGGLTKMGSGQLTISGANNYSGSTVISQGTLALADASATLLNSTNISLGSGTVFDVNPASVYTLSASASQTLSGVGVVNGSVDVPAGTTLSPATATTTGTLTFSDSFSTATVNLHGNLNMNVTTPAHDKIVADYVYIYSGVVLTIPSTTLANGQYDLIHANAYLLASPADITLVFSQPGKSGSLVLSGDGLTLYLEISDAASDDLTWSGNGAGWDTAGGSAPWYLTGTSTPWGYTNGDTVRFDETGSFNAYVNVTGPVKPSLLVANNTTDYTLADGGGGKVSGAARLLKQGTGTLNIYTVNDNTGSTTIEGGKIYVTGAMGSGAVTNNAELELAPSVAPITMASLSGSGDLTVSGANTATIAGKADYTGHTTISFGNLQIGTGGPEGVMSTADIVNDGTLTLNSSTDWNYSMTDEGTGILIKDGSNTLTMSGITARTGQTRVNAGKIILSGADYLKGPVRLVGGVMDMNGFDQRVTSLEGNGTYDGGMVVNNVSGTNFLTVSNTANVNYGGKVSDNEGSGGVVAFIKQGAGQLDWRSGKSYSGGSWIQEGNARCSSSAAFGTGPVYLQGGTVGLASSSSHSMANTFYLLPPLGGRTNTVKIDYAYYMGLIFSGTADLVINNAAGNTTSPYGPMFNDVTNTTYVRGTGWFRINTATECSGVTFDLSDSSITINAQSTHDWYWGGLRGNPTTASVGDSESLTVHVGYKNGNDTYAGNLSGNFSWDKVGTGTQTFTGTNTAAGSLSVSSGTLVLSGAAAPTSMSAFTVASGATLDLSALSTPTLTLDGSKSLVGAGTILGNVTSTTNTTSITVGPGIGTLTVSGNVTVGGALNMELDTSTPQTNDMVVSTGGTIAGGGGTLYVANVGPALHVGDVFHLFPSAVSGFSAVSISPIDASGAVYTWTNKVAIDGTIEVIGIDERIFAITRNTQLLISFGSSNSATILSANAYTGLQSGEEVVGMDFYGGTLYAVGSFSRLYTLNPATGAATLVGAFTPALSGTAFGVDADASGIRIMSDLGQNLVLNPATAAATAGPTLTFSGESQGFTSPNVVGLASNPGTGNSYVLDNNGATAVNNYAGTVTPASGGVALFSANSGIDWSRYNGFDISPNSGHTAYLGSPAQSSGTQANLYTLDLTTGFASFAGTIGDAEGYLIQGLAVAPIYAAPVANPTIDVVVTGGGNILSLSWPGYSGWTLQAQTNSLSVGLSGNWVDVPGSESVTTMDIDITKTNPMVLYRLVLP